MRSFILVLLVVLFVMPVGIAHATDIRVGETVFAPAHDVVSGNLYIAGGDATLSSLMEKDVIATAGKVIVNGPVKGDLLVAGGVVDILEHIAGDVRVAGGQVIISGSVGGDVVALGGSVHLLPGAAVSGDLIIVGGTVVVDGTVNGDTRVYAGDIVLNGLMGGSVSVRAGDKVSFGEHAVAGSVLTYAAPQEAEIHEAAKLGDNVTFRELDIPTRSIGPGGVAALLAAAAGFIFIVKLVTGLAAAVALVLIFPGFSDEIVDGAYTNFWKAVGVGFGALLIVPASVLLLAVTIIGLLGSMILSALFGLVLLLAGVYGGVICGTLIATWIKKERSVSWVWAAVGTVVLFLASLVPFVGWLVGFVFFLAALGTITLGIHRRALGGM